LDKRAPERHTNQARACPPHPQALPVRRFFYLGDGIGRRRAGHLLPRKRTSARWSRQLGQGLEHDLKEARIIINKAAVVSRGREVVRKVRELVQRKGALELTSLPGQLADWSGARPGRKSTRRMLANVLLRTQGKNQLLVAATDLNVSLTAELWSQNATEGGLTLGGKNLYEVPMLASRDRIDHAPAGTGARRPLCALRAHETWRPGISRAPMDPASFQPSRSTQLFGRRTTSGS
jgi:hypothetical protein